MDGLIIFGTIITFKNSQRYIFLAEIGHTTYLARIIDESTSKDFIARRRELEQQIEKGNQWAKEKLSSPLYCFVVLETNDFRGCIASMIKPSLDSKQFDPVFLYGQITQTDIEALKKLILESEENLPPELRDYIKKLS